MPSRGIFFVVLSLWLLLPPLAGPLAAQEEPGRVGRVYSIKPKPGMEQQFEAALKQHRDWLRQQNETWEWDVLQVVTGEDTGVYDASTWGHRWQDFDAHADLGTAMQAHWYANVAPYVESLTSSFWLYRPDLSRPPESAGPFPINAVYTIHLKMGMEAEYMNAVRKVHQAIEKTNWPVRYWFLQLLNGGELPAFVFALPYKNWAGLQPPEKSFPAMLEEAYGRQEAQTILKTFTKATHCERSSISQYRPDLSYVPASP